MALNTVSSDRLSTNVKTSNLGTELKKKVGQNKNLIINGAMQVAQRGTSSTSSGYRTIDRFTNDFGGNDEAPTYEQVDIASGTTPYTLGFRKSAKITNGNQTSGAGAGDYIAIGQRIEAQNVATSGWNYLSSSSNITFSFWVKSSVAQSFKGYFKTYDGSGYIYSFDTGSLSANTWTKVTKTIPGNSNLTFNNDNGLGLEMYIWQFIGTDYTDNSVTENAWASYASGTRTKDATSTWYTTNDATFELTGLQLELGSVATEFEHRSFGQELALCQRYYQRYREGNNISLGLAFAFGTNEVDLPISFIVPMRTAPSIDQNVSTSGYVGIENDSIGGSQYVNNNFTLQFGSTNGCNIYADPSPTLTVGQACHLTLRNAAAYLAFNAEL